MSRGALLAGTAGGIMGTVTVVVAFIWSLSYEFFSKPVPLFIFHGNFWYSGPSMATIFFTIIFVVLLVVSCILTGVGFYGTYKVSGSAIGIIGLISGIIGGIAAGIPFLIGSFTASDFYLTIGWQLYPYYSTSSLWNGTGFIILGVSFVIMGCASIVVHKYVMHSRTAVAAGILSIIGGITLIFVFTWIGLALMFMFVAFLLWAIVFYTIKP